MVAIAETPMRRCEPMAAAVLFQTFHAAVRGEQIYVSLFSMEFLTMQESRDGFSRLVQRARDGEDKRE